MRNFFSVLLSVLSFLLSVLLSVLFPLIILAFCIWLAYTIGESDLPLWVKIWLLR